MKLKLKLLLLLCLFAIDFSISSATASAKSSLSALSAVQTNGSSILDQINQQLNNHYAGLEKNIISNGMMIYPNPANSIVNVKYHLQENESGVLKLFNIVGNEVRKVDLQSRNNQISFSVADLMTGVYIYKYSINGKLNSTGKLIIE